MVANLPSLATMTLLGHYEFNPALSVLVVVPVDEHGNPLTGLPFESKGPAGGIRPILHLPEQGFGVRVFV